MDYEKMIEELEYAPRMNTFAIKLSGGHYVQADELKVVAGTEEEAKTELTKLITAHIEGKQPIVRIMPNVSMREDGSYRGRARIAVIPIVSGL